MAFLVWQITVRAEYPVVLVFSQVIPLIAEDRAVKIINPDI